MQWCRRLPEYNSQVMYKKDPLDVQADALSRVRSLAETTTDDWDKITSFLLNKKFLEHTDIHHADDTTLPHKLRFNYAHNDTQLQRE